MTSSLIRSRVFIAAKILFGVGLIAVLISSVDLSMLIERFRSINIAYLLAVFILPHIAMLLSSRKWQILLIALNIRFHLYRLFNLYMIGTFFSNFLPTMVGGDVYKSFALSRETGDAASVLAATFLERFLGLTALVSLLPLVIFQDAVRSAVPVLGLVVIGISASYILLLALVISPFFDYFGNSLPRFKIARKVWRFASKAHANIQRIRGFRGTLLWSYGISNSQRITDSGRLMAPSQPVDLATGCSRVSSLRRRRHIISLAGRKRVVRI